MTEVDAGKTNAPILVPAVAAQDAQKALEIGKAAVVDFNAAAPAEKAVEAQLAPVLGGEPALIVGLLVAVAIAVLAITGILPVATGVGIVTAAAPIVGGFITRFLVSPAKKSVA